MKIKKYTVLWHEENESGVSRNVMGQSPLFNTEEEAKRWLEDTVEEDRARFDKDKRERTMNGLEVHDTFVFDALTDSERIWYSHGNGQEIYYSLEKLDVDDRAADCLAELKEILKPTVIDGKPINCDERIKSALIYIGEHEHEWLPLRKWSVEVDICSGGASCAQFAMARTADEARQIVEQRIDSGHLELTDCEKAEIVDELLRNTGAITASGPVEELS